jgi:hypothetical protein
LTRILSIILTTFILCSCGTGLNIRKSKIKYFDSGFSATVDNKSFKVKGRRYGDLTLLNLFKIREATVDSVHLDFNDKKELQFTYIDKGQKTVKTFTGNFSKKGFYEIYFRNQKKEIPPLFPIFYSNNHINRVRLALTHEGDLIVDNMWDDSGNIFILATGSSGRRQSFFKRKTITKTIQFYAIKTIEKVFEDYIKYQESTDSQVDKDSMSKSLESLNVVVEPIDLDVLINVWMYYDPTDFPSRPLIYEILKNSRPSSIEAVKTRVKNKKEWESTGTAPYADLYELLKKLEIEK